jgi:hypothetical protein
MMVRLEKDKSADQRSNKDRYNHNIGIERQENRGIASDSRDWVPDKIFFQNIRRATCPG